MKLGIGVVRFSWPGPVTEIGPIVSRIATAADQAGIDSIWTMDHFFQIRFSGLPPESPMLEAYATLAFIAGRTERIRLGTLVTSVPNRHPGVLVKQVTSLDVLTGGRMIMGVGQARRTTSRRGSRAARRPPWASPTRRPWPSGSTASRSCCRSPTRCGAATRPRTTASTTSSAGRSTPPTPCSARTRRS